MTKMERGTQEHKRRIAEAYSGKTCTLDGELAFVIGRCEPFATIVGFSSGRRFEWAWETVERVMRVNRGAFVS